MTFGTPCTNLFILSPFSEFFPTLPNQSKCYFKQNKQTTCFLFMLIFHFSLILIFHVNAAHFLPFSWLLGAKAHSYRFALIVRYHGYVRSVCICLWPDTYLDSFKIFSQPFEWNRTIPRRENSCLADIWSKVGCFFL